MHPVPGRPSLSWEPAEPYLACEQLLPRVAEDVRAQEDPAREGLPAVGTHVGQRGAGPVLQQLGGGGLVGSLRVRRLHLDGPRPHPLHRWRRWEEGTVLIQDDKPPL